MAGRVLLVGELSEDLTDLRVTFQDLGLTVEMAPDGLAGIETVKEFQPDLVVTEILTNRLSGFELASRISSGAAGFASPVIFYTEFYRDEKARREVLAKYGASQYLVRPFQKEALKKLVAAHFQDFLSRLPVVPVTESPGPKASSPDVNPVAPQLSRAAAATEQKLSNPLPGRLIQPGKPGGISGEVPNRFRAFSTAPQAPSAAVAELGTQAGAMADRPENAPVAVPAMPISRAETAPAPAKSAVPFERGLLLPVEEPSWIGRLLQSAAFRIAAGVTVVALALYLARDRFQSGNQQGVTQPLPVATEPSPPVRTMAEPSAQLDSPPATAPSSLPPAEDSSQVATVQAGTELTKPHLSSTADLNTQPDSLEKNETMDSRAAVRTGSPALSIQDVTGSGRGPVLRKMKPIQLSQDVLGSLGSKAVVVRVVVDPLGKVTEVTPLTQEGSTVALPASALAAIEQWEFSHSRRKDGGESVKYFSLKVQSPR